MKGLIRTIRSEKLGALLLLFFFIFNSIIFSQVSAQYTPSAGASNLYSRVDASVFGASSNSGVLGNLVNQALNGLVTQTSYSTLKIACKDAGSKCETTAQINKVLAGIDNKFSAVDLVANVNNTVLAQRPASGSEFVQDKIYAISNFGSVSAQIDSRNAYYSPGGTGFSLLRPIQGFWSWSVRIVYGFLLLIVIIIAFAIMFRQKLSGNVEVTIQNAIPAIALAMILVPLSYAISGLFIDIITVGTNATHAFLIGTPGSPGYSVFENSGDANKKLGDAPDRGYYPDDPRVDWLRARDQVDVSGTFAQAGQDLAENAALNGTTIFKTIGNIVSSLTGGNPAEFAWFGDIIQFIISIATLWIGIKVFVALFKHYMNMILFPVLSPFIFATVAMPGNGTKSVIDYMKVLFAASLSYIATYGMFLLTIIFTSDEFLAEVPTFASGSFNPPLLGLGAIGIESNTLTQLLLTLVGLGIYFSIPNTIASINKSLGADKPLPKFITTPWESFNESRRVMFRTAPAMGARTALTGGRLARDGTLAPLRANTAARNLLDRVRGIDPETDYRSYTNRRRAALQRQRDDNQARRDRARGIANPLARNVRMARANLSDVGATLTGAARATGSTLPGNVNRPRLEVSGNRIEIRRSDLPSFLTQAGYVYNSATGMVTAPGGGLPVRPGNPVTIGFGTLEFRISGERRELFAPYQVEFSRTRANRINPTIREFDPAAGAVTPGATPFGDTVDQYELRSAAYPNRINIPAVAGPQPFFIEVDTPGAIMRGDTIRVDYTIVSEDLIALIGNELTVGNYSPVSNAAILTAGSDIRTDERAVRIRRNNDFISDPFRITVTLV